MCLSLMWIEFIEHQSRILENSCSLNEQMEKEMILGANYSVQILCPYLCLYYFGGKPWNSIEATKILN